MSSFPWGEGARYGGRRKLAALGMEVRQTVCGTGGDRD